MTSEDIANIGPAALLRDLAVQALLGHRSIERNGRHYFRGRKAWPRDRQTAMCDAHSDLYAPHPAHGRPILCVSDFRLQLGGVNAAPFGMAPLLDPSTPNTEICVPS